MNKMKKPDKVLKMKLVPADKLDKIVYDLYAIQDLLKEIGGIEEQPNTVDGIRYFLQEVTNKLDELSLKGELVRWIV